MMIEVEVAAHRVRTFTKLLDVLRFVEMSNPVTCVMQKMGDTYYLEYSETEGETIDGDYTETV